MFGVDERADAAPLLRLGDDVQRQRGLARGFRPVDLDHPAARQAADPQRDVEAERAGRDGLDLHRLLVLAQAHDRALAERAFDLRQRGVERLGLVHESSFHDAKIGLAHGCHPSLTVGAHEATAASATPLKMTMCMVCSRAQVLFLFSQLPCRTRGGRPANPLARGFFARERDEARNGYRVRLYARAAAGAGAGAASSSLPTKARFRPARLAR